MNQLTANDAESVGVTSGASFQFSTKAVALFMLMLACIALACHFINADSAATAALKVITATLGIGLVPGVLVTLLWQPRPNMSLLEVSAFGIAVSFGLAHLLAIIAISAHVSPVVSLSILGIASMLITVCVMRRPAGRIEVTLDEVIVLVLLVILGWSLYLVGAPVDSSEDQIHAGIALRLSQLANPGLDNVYLVPRLVYTYPFPGTHYFMGLISRFGDIDTFFVYHKLRFFWGTTAVLMLFVMARAAFGSRAVACATAVVAVVLVASGNFAMGFPSGWGQLVPYSHASDIAMTVLLPSLLAVAFWYIQAESKREQAFFLTATGLLVVMLTMVHIREIVQFAVYVSSFAIVTLVFRVFRPYLRRACVLLALTLVVATIYASWQSRMVPLVDNIVSGKRAELLSIAETNSFATLLFAPAPIVLGDFLQKSDQIFRDLLPFFLFAGPTTILLFRSRPLVWLIAASTVAYLLLMSVPLFATPYIYLTYFEILHWPVRNVIFFVYLCAGVPLYALLVGLMRFDPTRLSPLVVGIGTGSLALLMTLTINRSHQGFFMPLIAAYTLTFLLVARASGSRMAKSRLIGTVLLGVITLVLVWPDHPAMQRSEQVTVRWTSGLPDARRAALERELSLGTPEPKPDRTEEVNAWNYRLSDLSIENVRRIVGHPEVVDTHFIDRSTFEVESQPPPGDNHPMGLQYVRWMQYPGLPLLLLAAFSAWLLAVLVPMVLASRRGTDAVASLGMAIHAPFYRRALPFALLIIPFALWSARPALSPIVAAGLAPGGRFETPAALVTKQPCVTSSPMQARFTEHLFPQDQVILPERTFCPPDLGLLDWIRREVPAEAVFAIDRWNPYPPSTFVPQQIVVFPTLEAAFVTEDRLFREYYEFFYERMRQYRAQPFFNTVETPAERSAFVDALGVTHILIGPAHYDTLRPVLDRLADQYILRYSQARWAVYEVAAHKRDNGRVARNRR